MERIPMTFKMGMVAFKLSQFDDMGYDLAVTMMAGSLYAEDKEKFYALLKPILSEAFSDYVKSGNAVKDLGISDEEWLARSAVVMSNYSTLNLIATLTKDVGSANVATERLTEAINGFVKEKGPDSPSKFFSPTMLLAVSKLVDVGHGYRAFAVREDGGAASEPEATQPFAAALLSWRSMLLRFFHESGVHVKDSHVKRAVVDDSFYSNGSLIDAGVRRLMSSMLGSKFTVEMDLAWTKKHATSVADFGNSESTLEKSARLFKEHGDEIMKLMSKSADQSIFNVGNEDKLPDFIKEIAVETEEKFKLISQEKGLLAVSESASAGAEDIWSRTTFVAAG